MARATRVWVVDDDPELRRMLAAYLTDQGYDVRSIYLTESGRVPPSCDVLVIAGPRLEPEPRELAAIDKHLARGGAVLALFDPQVALHLLQLALALHQKRLAVLGRLVFEVLAQITVAACHADLPAVLRNVHLDQLL